MILEINDKSYNDVLELITQRIELIEKYNVISDKINDLPFDEEYLEYLIEDNEEYLEYLEDLTEDDVEYFNSLTEEQLNEIMEISDEMARIRSQVFKLNMQIAMCVESILISYIK